MSILNSSQYACEWDNCGESFADRLKFLSHITHFHVAAYSPNQNCQWNGCEHGEFHTMQSFQLHMSLHAAHQQYMHNGYKLMIAKSMLIIIYYI